MIRSVATAAAAAVLPTLSRAFVVHRSLVTRTASTLLRNTNNPPDKAATTTAEHRLEEQMIQSWKELERKGAKLEANPSAVRFSPSL